MIWLSVLSPDQIRKVRGHLSSNKTIEDHNLVGAKILKWIGCWWVHGTEGRAQEKRQKGAALRGERVAALIVLIPPKGKL